MAPSERRNRRRGGDDRSEGEGEVQRSRRDAFRQRIAEEVQRRRRARKRSPRSAWMGLRYFGMIGWPVVIMTLLGGLAGAWLERRVGGSVPWDLMGLLLGAVAGSVVAAYWISVEQRRIDRGNGDDRGTET